MHVGVMMPQLGCEWDDILAFVGCAEELGLDSVWVIDHVFGFPTQAGIFEAWTVMSAVAASTTRLEIGAQVHCQSFRNPALFAKMTATLDQVSAGRLRMLLGAGWYEAEYKAFGYDFPAPGVRIGELRDTLAIMKGLLAPHDSFTYEGEHYAVRECVNKPLPIRQPFPLEVGGGGDRLLRTVARQADGFNCPAALLPLLDQRLDFLAKACADEGRSISDLRLSCQIVGAVGDEEALQNPLLAMFNPALGLVGTVDQAAARARELIDKGITDFNCIIPIAPMMTLDRSRACMERLAEVRAKV